jgi:hypothetical protein
VPAVLRYVRSTIRKPRTGQRVRLQATVPAVSDEVFNLTSSFGNYARVSTINGNIRFAYSHDPVPFSYEFEVTATNTGDCATGRFCWTPRQRLHLTYYCPTETLERTSDDDGRTWSGETTIFANARHPDIACSTEGTILRAAHETATNKITCTRQYTGEAAAGSPFYLKNAAGADITIEDDSFRLCPDLRGWWWLHVRLAGGSATSLLFSTDDGETFAATAGAVTGISSGTHPGFAAGHDGTLWAWAYLGGEVAMTRRYPGEVDWSSPVSVQDNLGADLAVKDIPSSMALAWEGPKRLILATIYSTHVGPSDWWSSDDATSFKRFLGT